MPRWRARDARRLLQRRHAPVWRGGAGQRNVSERKHSVHQVPVRRVLRRRQLHRRDTVPLRHGWHAVRRLPEEPPLSPPASGAVCGVPGRGTCRAPRETSCALGVDRHVSGADAGGRMVLEMAPLQVAAEPPAACVASGRFKNEGPDQLPAARVAVRARLRHRVAAAVQGVPPRALELQLRLDQLASAGLLL